MSKTYVNEKHEADWRMSSYIKRLKSRISELEGAIAQLIEPMDPDYHLREEMQQLIDKGNPLPPQVGLADSPYRGVRYARPNKAWEARLQLKGVDYRSQHETEFDAACAYDEMVEEFLPPEQWWKRNYQPTDKDDLVVSINRDDLRKFARIFCDKKTLKRVCPRGAEYLTRAECDLIAQHIKETKGIDVHEWVKDKRRRHFGVRRG